MDSDEITVKQKYEDAIFPFKGKDKNVLLKNGAFDRKMLIETVLALNAVCMTLFDTSDAPKLEVDKVSDSIDKMSDSVDKISDSVEKIADSVVAKTKDIFLKLLDKHDSNFSASDKTDATKKGEDKHVIIVENQNDVDSAQFTSDTWADVLKNNISHKLENVPVTRTYLNREGKGHIVLPNERTCTDAKRVLEGDFQVSQNVVKPKLLLPKLKIHNLKTDQFDSNDQLQELITRKNPQVNEVLRNNTRSKLIVLFTDKNFNYSVIKVTPDVREVIMRTSKVHINLDSFYVSDHYHVDQCYACQGYGHRQDSVYCPKKDEQPTCLYCSGAHRSKMCRFKNNAEKHRCANCAKSPVPGIKAHANDHKAGSKRCPVYNKEIQYAKKRTCFDVKNYPDM